MKKVLQYILFILCLIAGQLKAQEPVFRVLDYKSGLPSNTIYNILQDAHGYIWISHDKGLSRYNGQRVKNYASQMLQSRGVSNLNEDKFGKIWCQNFSGEIFFTTENGLTQDSLVVSKGNFIPFQIYDGSKLVSIQNEQLHIQDIVTGSVSQLKSGNRAFTPSNILVKENKIYALINKGESIVRFSSLKQDVLWKLPSIIKPFLFESNENNLFIFPKNSVDKAAILDEKTGNLVYKNLGFEGVIQNVALINKEIWISTSEGAYKFDLNLNMLHNGKPYFPKCNISKIIQDKEGMIWMSTLNMGVIIVPDFNVENINSGASSITTASYFSSVNKIILGTADNTILELDPKTRTTRLLKVLGPRNDVLHIYNDVANDRIWIASDKMYSLKGGANTIEFAMSVPMKDITFIGSEFYAMATPEGIVLIRSISDTSNQTMAKALTGKAIPWLNNRQLLPGSEGRAKAVLWDPNSQTLYGSNYKGLFSWTIGGQHKNIQYKNKNIYASDILLKGTKVFVGTYGGKLYILEDGKIIKVIENFEGLKGLSITRLRQFGDFLWILFENSLVRYDIYKGVYNIYNATDGLPNTEIKDISIANGMVYLATRDGLVSFSENIKTISEQPTVLIEDFEVNHISKPNTGEVISLRTNENNLEITLAVLSFRNNDDIKLWYRLNDKEWMPLSTGRVLHLVGLSPGSYQVHFKAVTSDGREIPANKVLKFRIAAPVYARWWFILLILLFISALVFYFMRFRIFELKKEAEFKSARERLERELQISTLASIKSQMNPHFVFNALNTVQSFIFTNDRDSATDYLSKFSELTRMILDMSNKEKITLSEEIKGLTLYLDLEKRRFEDTIEYSIVVNENINPDMVQIPSMLIQPYVENAIKHGLLHKRGDRKLKIEFLREENAVIAFIDDNGIGRKKSQELKAMKPSSHKSFASEANSKRLQLLNQGRNNTIDIEYLDKIDSYGNSLGTMVVLAIPLSF